MLTVLDGFLFALVFIASKISLAYIPRTSSEPCRKLPLNMRLLLNIMLFCWMACTILVIFLVLGVNSLQTANPINTGLNVMVHQRPTEMLFTKNKKNAVSHKCLYAS